MAHEYAHVTASVWNTSLWDMAGASELLHQYEMSKWVEAIADLAGVAIVMKLGQNTKETLCGHVSQLWCAREGWLYSSRSERHPRANFRGDALCAFLRSNF